MIQAWEDLKLPCADEWRAKYEADKALVEETSADADHRSVNPDYGAVSFELCGVSI